MTFTKANRKKPGSLDFEPKPQEAAASISGTPATNGTLVFGGFACYLAFTNYFLETTGSWGLVVKEAVMGQRDTLFGIDFTSNSAHWQVVFEAHRNGLAKNAGSERCKGDKVGRCRWVFCVFLCFLWFFSVFAVFLSIHCNFLFLLVCWSFFFLLIIYHLFSKLSFLLFSSLHKLPVQLATSAFEKGCP